MLSRVGAAFCILSLLLITARPADVTAVAAQQSSRPDQVVNPRSGPRIVDSVLSEISTGFQAAVFTATCSKYTASGVRRSSAV